MPIHEQLSENEARAIHRNGLGRVELEFVNSLCTPLFWDLRGPGESRNIRNGSAFFLNLGQRVIGVTACHVIEAWLSSRARGNSSALYLGANGAPFELNWDERFIDKHAEIDIATFDVSNAEVRGIGKEVLTGFQRTWPPGPPEINCGVCYSGFPGVCTIRHTEHEVSFGAACGSGIATSINDKDISVQIERDHLSPELGRGIPPENFDFRGMSGGPMLYVTQSGLYGWALAGVITQGPNNSDNPEQAIAGLEIIKARRAYFIGQDGYLDSAHWDSVN